MTVPRGWAVARLEDVVVERVSQGEPTSEPVQYIDIGAIDRERKKITETQAVTSSTAPTRARQWVKAGDVLVSMTRPNLNAVAQVPEFLDGAVASTGFDVLRAIGVLPEWIYYRVRSHAFIQDVCEDVQGVVYPAIRPADIRRHELPVPPRVEQARIVESLESHLSRLDAAVQILASAQQKLKAYRASVLKAAVEGRLVPTEAELARKTGRWYEPADTLLQRILKERRRRWEEAELATMKAAGKTPKDNRWKDKYSEPTLDKRELPSLPEGWQWARLDQVSEVQLGQQRAPVHAAASDQLPYVRAANITWDGLDLGDVKTMGFPNPERYRLKFGDVLLSEASGSPMEAGKPAVWRDEIPGACYQKTLLRIRTFETDSLLPAYLRLVFLRDCVTGKFARLAPGVGIVHLTAERMLPWPVPVPPRAEQQRIVDEVERLETVQNSVRATIARERARIGRLRQAVLTWAFDGRLVEQVPDDEPAAVLLGRIRAKRANKTPTTPKARRARKLKAAS